MDALAAAVFLLPADDPPPPPTPDPSAVAPTSPDPGTPQPTARPSKKPADKVQRAPSLRKVYAGQARIRKGMQGESVKRLQVQLNGIGKPAPVTGVMDRATARAYRSFQEKFDFFPTGIVGQKSALELKALYGRGELPKACRTGRILCIDKTQRVLRLMVGGKQRLVTDVRFGTELTPTRDGMHRVERKVRYLISELAGSPMPYSLFFSGGQAVHFSPGFRRDGYNGGSLGCVNIRVYRHAREVYQRSPLGTPVLVYRS
jgi:peptidoglycan hydrolase-like protein with peptidoglycan-binding domain